MAKPILVYHPEYKLELGEHVFPGLKYPLVYEELCKSGLISDFEVVTPSPAKRSELLLVHSNDYIRDFTRGKHTFRTFLSEMPLDERIARSFLLMCGGTIRAAQEALAVGAAINVAGGFHHGYPSHAEGFCYLNDIAIATRVLLKQQLVKKVLIIDLDTHQGNGTSYIFRDDEDVFTCSLHQQLLYPPKERSDLDVGLRKGVEDDDYLEMLEQALHRIDERFAADLVFVVAGADILMTDSLGQLMLSKEGIAARDDTVITWARGKNRALVITLGGGYARHLQDTIDVHAGTIYALRKNFP